MWSRGLVKSREKLKLFHLHYYSTYDHQAWQYGNLSWEAPIVIVTRPFNYVDLRDNVTN